MSPFYDSMVLKIICHGETRDEAILSSHQALSELDIQGIDINSDFAKSILMHKDFKTGNIHTKWIEQVLSKELFK